MRVLIVKTSSMGDIIHTLPALTDAAQAIPGITFDWVVEEAFAEIPTWHPQVNRVIPIAWRRWRKQLRQALREGVFKQFYQQLTATHYDFIIDAQALLKSAVITALARGVRCGHDAATVRGRFSHLAYQKKYHVIREQHAITRARQLFAEALGYPQPQGDPDYAVQRDKLLPVPAELPPAYVVMVHNASWDNKIWPENYWRVLIEKVTPVFPVVVPWGNPAEYARAARLAADNPRVHLLPRMKLAEIATLIAQAKAVVAGDTGIAHLTAALGVPSVTLYGPTDAALIGTLGPRQLHVSAQFPCAPCRLRQCVYRQPSEEWPACFTTVSPERVWQALASLL